MAVISNAEIFERKELHKKQMRKRDKGKELNDEDQARLDSLKRKSKEAKQIEREAKELDFKRNVLDKAVTIGCDRFEHFIQTFQCSGIRMTAKEACELESDRIAEILLKFTEETKGFQSRGAERNDSDDDAEEVTFGSSIDVGSWKRDLSEQLESKRGMIIMKAQAAFLESGWNSILESTKCVILTRFPISPTSLQAEFVNLITNVDDQINMEFPGGLKVRTQILTFFSLLKNVDFFRPNP
jgi:hypothetical protein